MTTRPRLDINIKYPSWERFWFKALVTYLIMVISNGCMCKNTKLGSMSMCAVLCWFLRLMFITSLNTAEMMTSTWPQKGNAGPCSWFAGFQVCKVRFFFTHWLALRLSGRDHMLDWLWAFWLIKHCYAFLSNWDSGQLIIHSQWVCCQKHSLTVTPP